MFNRPIFSLMLNSHVSDIRRMISNKKNLFSRDQSFVAFRAPLLDNRHFTVQRERSILVA